MIDYRVALPIMATDPNDFWFGYSLLLAEAVGKAAFSLLRYLSNKRVLND
jgi:hypothetical protein